MPEYCPAPDLENIARRLVVIKEDLVGHVDVDEVLFLREMVTRNKKTLARCHKFGKDHPWWFYSDKPYCIVIYHSMCDYMSLEQLVLLVLHEMMHIGARGGRLRDHTIKDFRALLGINLDWARDGVEVPDILNDMK
jgi:predicted metallopeptidase